MCDVELLKILLYYSESEGSEDLEENSNSDYDTDEVGVRRGRRRNEPVRRSSRARIARYDKDFSKSTFQKCKLFYYLVVCTVDDESDSEDKPKKKKTHSRWSESESEESDQSWGGGKRKKSARPPKFSYPKKSKKKKRRKNDGSDGEEYKKKRIQYGGLDDDDEYKGRRTRGKKINYLDALGSESEEVRKSHSTIKLAFNPAMPTHNDI